MIEKHQGKIQFSHSFDEVYTHLNQVGKINLKTSVGTNFQASSSTARDGRSVIRFFQDGKEYGRAYKCCWGHYYNCNRTRIGMYAESLDNLI